MQLFHAAAEEISSETGLAMGQWSELLGELLDEIEGLLISYHDKVRVRAVCVSWNSHLPKARIPLPRLLQAFESESNPTHGLYNLLDKKFDLLDLPELQAKVFKGSSYGWVVATDDSPGRRSSDIFLINPLTRVKIELPPRHTFPDVKEYNVDRANEEYTLDDPKSSEGPIIVPSNFVHLNLINKVVLSSPPASEDCVVAAIYGEFGRVAWCKCNDKSWTPLEGAGKPLIDLLFYKGRLHVVTDYELLVFEDIGGPNQKVTKIISLPDRYTDYPGYLGESSGGDLLLVGRCFHEDEDEDPYNRHAAQTKAFPVYKLDQSNSSWIRVKNISDDMLFLGVSSFLSISSRKFPGYKGNCIYYTGDPSIFGSKLAGKADSDIGVFNMEDETIESLPGFKCVPRFLWPPPVWVYEVE